MKVYGFDLLDVERGEMRAAEVPADQYEHFATALCRELDWACIDTSFNFARKELIFRMKAAGVDRELISNVRSMRAHYVSVSEVIEA